MIGVYVPAPGLLTEIDRGSGIVGSRQAEDEWLIDYEGNRYGYANVKTFADRVARAYDRHESRYPTVARMLVHRRSLVRIGSYDPKGRAVVVVGPHQPLADWLGVEELDPLELLVT
jgi:hypothetical protein